MKRRTAWNRHGLDTLFSCIFFLASFRAATDDGGAETVMGTSVFMTQLWTPSCRPCPAYGAWSMADIHTCIRPSQPAPQPQPQPHHCLYEHSSRLPENAPLRVTIRSTPPSPPTHVIGHGNGRRHIFCLSFQPAFFFFITNFISYQSNLDRYDDRVWTFGHLE